MQNIVVKFDNAPVAVVQVPDAQWNQATGIVGAPNIDSETRECVAVAKIRQAGLPCAAPTHASHDVRINFGTGLMNVDIKTLYPSWAARNGHGSITEDILDKVDAEVKKEIGQGCVCLFDLSYINRGVVQNLVGAIHNCYPNHAITLEYDYANSQLHVIFPNKFEFHMGINHPNWYH